MVLAQSVVHPRGLHPVMALRAHDLYTEEGSSYAAICDEVYNLQDERAAQLEVRVVGRQADLRSLDRQRWEAVVGDWLQEVRPHLHADRSSEGDFDSVLIHQRLERGDAPHCRRVALVQSVRLDG